MMKKVLAMMMVMALTVALAACGRGNDDSTTEAPSTGASTTEAPETEATTTEAPETEVSTTETPTETEGSPEDLPTEGNGADVPAEGANSELYALLDRMYANAPALEGLSAMTIDVDLSDIDSCVFYIGTGAEGIDSAVVSEPMMSSIAHSVALIQTAEGADVEAIKQAIFDGVDPIKWLCVTADKVVVTNSDNLILMMMTSADAADQLLTAFTDAMGGNVGEALERAGE